MYSSCHSPPKKKSIPNGFFIQKQQWQPNRFRNTLVNSEPPVLSQIGRLRSSFSMRSIPCFEPLVNSSPVSQQQKNRTYQHLKSTLDQLQISIKNARQAFSKKNKCMQKMGFKINSSKHLETNFQEKKRETVSTQMTNHNPDFLKISQYITSEPKPPNYHPFTINPYTTRQHFYYISEALRAINEKNSLAIEHIGGSIKMIKSCAQYFDQCFNIENSFNLPRRPRDEGKKTLVLDLDQTLIHCYENLQIETDMRLKMNIQGTRVQVGINIRPYAMTFLKRMSKKFQIIIFTASHKAYADVILDQLDPEDKIFSHRLYRQHCIVLPNDLHVKDLRYLNRNLKDVILVDNAAYSYSFQLDNGIPILPYYEGKDFQLTTLQKYLQKIQSVQDVREVNRKYFKLHSYTTFQTAEELVQQLYQQQIKSCKKL